VDTRYWTSSSWMTIYDYDQKKNISQNGIKTSGGHLIVWSAGVSIMKETSQLLDVFTST
jgi:hypothetical protein